jgi:hypothetical protein
LCRVVSIETSLLLSSFLTFIFVITIQRVQHYEKY